MEEDGPDDIAWLARLQGGRPDSEAEGFPLGPPGGSAGRDADREDIGSSSARGVSEELDELHQVVV